MRPTIALIVSSISLIMSQAMAAPVLINGAGSTFAAPLYAKWIVEYRQTDPSVEINYQSIGSGGGVRQFLAGTTDFGGTDDPLKDDEMRAAKDLAVHIPTALGAVVLTYNLPGAPKGIKLTADVIADIYMGKITKWDDARLKALNPGVTLPSQFIVVCHRADGSGTTAVFTEYLYQTSPEFAKQVGKGKSVKFSTGIGGKGNEGVTGLVKQNPGAIGYVELTFAKVNNLPVAEVKNRAGKFIAPSEESVVAAAASLKSIPSDLRMNIINAAGEKSYPLSSFTYIVAAQRMPAAKGEPFVRFLKWALGPGQKLTTTLHYGPLPESIVQRGLQAVGTIRMK